MKTNTLLIILSLLCRAMIGSAQLSEHFTDGNLSVNPVWAGDTASWKINANLQLQSNNTIVNSTYSITTANSMATGVQWEFYLKIGFNPSSANYIDVFLTATDSMLNSSNNDAYFVRIGNTADEISLYRKDGSTSTIIINGQNGVLNNSSNQMKIKVIRDIFNQWTLFRDMTGTGNNYTAEGTVFDATYINSSYFGISVKQSTAGFFQKHYLDDIEIKPFIPDTIPPVAVRATAITNQTVDLLFNEPLDVISSQVAANYLADQQLGMPVDAVLDSNNNALIHLQWGQSMPNGVTCHLSINGVQDIAGNILNAGLIDFGFYTPSPDDIVIDELMADPTPVVGLPDNEWLELRNTSRFPINLNGWRIASNGSHTGTMPDFLLAPDSFVIVCSGSAVNNLSVYGQVISVTSFPSLNNDGDQLVLINEQGRVIHALQYSSSWYQNELKKSGGWSLEMIDTRNPCGGSKNWRASIDVTGGTLGRKNSVDSINPDTDGPALLRAFANDSIHLTLIFDEPLDSVQSLTTDHYLISDGIGNPVISSAAGPLFNTVNLTLNHPILPGNIYVVSVNGVTDCKGNPVGNKNTVRVGLSEKADSLDIVLNEILFNPAPGGSDYVELFNRSKKILDLKEVSLANRNSGAVISSIININTDHYLFFPEDYLVVTADSDFVIRNYLTPYPDKIVQVNSLPSWSDAEGDVILLNGQGDIIDELNYNSGWQFSLLNSLEGVALERIDYNGTTQSKDNWHSASSSVGYGTPTYKNSQESNGLHSVGIFTVSPEIISPDNDGRDDFATLQYEFSSPGYVVNITVFDALGRVVRYWIRNALCGTSGSFRWDGLGEKNHSLITGIYVIAVEAFNMEGKKKLFKLPVVIVGNH